MAHKLFEQIPQEGNLILQVTISDLRELVHGLYEEEKKKIEDAITQHREKPTLTRNEVAKTLGVTLTTLWQWAKSGYLVPVKIGTKVMYRATDVDALLERNLAK